MLDMATAVKTREAYAEEVHASYTASMKGCAAAGTVQTCLMACG